MVLIQLIRVKSGHSGTITVEVLINTLELVLDDESIMALSEVVAVVVMDCEKLIEFVKEHPILYDTSHPKYMDQLRKDKLWRIIAVRLNQHENDCKKVWQNLRDSFRRVLKKRKASRDLLLDGKPKVWKYEDEMSFLIPHFTTRTSRLLGSVERNQLQSEEEQSVDNFVEDQCTIMEQNESIQFDSSDDTKATTSCADSSATLVKYVLENQERYRSRLEEDDITSFFINMAKTVKTFSRYRRAEAKSKVFAIVSQLEFEQISEERDQNFRIALESDRTITQKPEYVNSDPLN
ncbi:Alcohol dehydrogenase transcription factor Myb/SANT-like [Popillia japonica]|uniref:Alcohol dehydrogenase transcription factor Myb/SANT-like n=1 Tax=Popillia japonica TaxID=7064 RepID=A0AAW1KG08_POPJA